MRAWEAHINLLWRSDYESTNILKSLKFCKAFGGIPCAKPVEMAHFNQSFHTASDALATSGMRSLLEATSPVPPEAAQNCIPVKQRRLSRPNNIEELRLKRRRRKHRERKRKESRNAKQRRLEDKIKRNIEEEFKARTRAATSQMKSKAEFFWRKWREEKSLRTTSRM